MVELRSFACAAVPATRSTVAVVSTVQGTARDYPVHTPVSRLRVYAVVADW
jgi:hypothetical protein